MAASERPAWDDAALLDPHGRADKARRVRSMFDAIAPSYERVNALASLGQDARWRRRAVEATEVGPADVVLDLCCGTGDMIRAFQSLRRAPRRIIGLDFSAQMLASGRYERTAAPLHLVRGDALRLPLRDACVDVVTCAFGVRNFQDLSAGLSEIARVLRPGGRVAILEFALPRGRLLRWGYRLYCETVLPRLGAWISGDCSGAYRYLPRSIETFAPPEAMCRGLAAAGLVRPGVIPMNFGGVAIYTAGRPAG